MSETWQVASITSFEEVPVGAAGALLRIAAVSTRPAEPDENRPTLVADDGYAVSYFAALPAPPDEGAELRCAFSVPGELVAADTIFSLELDDGSLIALASPRGADDRLRASDATAAEPFETDALNTDAFETDAAGFEAEPAPLPPVLDLLLEAAEARAELRAVHELTALAGASALPPVASDDALAQLAELQVWSSELERRLADTTTALADARAELERLGPHAGDGVGLTETDRAQIGAAAVEDAHRRAERDLADATS